MLKEKIRACSVLIVATLCFMQINILIKNTLPVAKPSPLINILNLNSEENYNNTNSIFFIEGFFNDYLRGRYLCSVESAAKIHPNNFVNVLMTSQSLKLTPSLKSLLNTYKNIRFLYLNSTRLIMEVPSLKEFYITKRWTESQWPRMHYSDLLRFLIIWKHGGIYLDLDVLTTKNLENDEQNFLGYSSKEYVNSAIMGFLPRHWFVKKILQEIPHFYDPTNFGTISPHLVTKVLIERCGLRPPLTSMKRCPDVKIYERKVFNPISWMRANKSFENDFVLAEKLMSDPKIFTFHYWNIITKQFRIDSRKQSPFAVLAKNFCPVVYRFDTHF
ncbi:UNVERIFIED_CONTAM: hypothetical protein RMT77_007858 [Armadillidium vulgare]